VALGLAPVVLSAGLMIRPMLENPAGFLPYAPVLPAILLLLMGSGVHDLAAAPPDRPNDKTWAVASLSLAVVAGLFAASFAALRVWRPDGSWDALAAPRLPLVLLAGWALSERLDQLVRALKPTSRESTLLDDMGSLTLLLGIPLVLPQVVPSLPTAQELLGPAGRPVMFFLLGGVVLGFVRLGSQLVTVARTGSTPEL